MTIWKVTPVLFSKGTPALEVKLNEMTRAGYEVVTVLPPGTGPAEYVIIARKGT